MTQAALHRVQAHGHDGHRLPQERRPGHDRGLHVVALVGLDVEEDHVGSGLALVEAQVAEQVVLHEDEGGQQEGPEAQGEHHRVWFAGR